MGGRLGRRTAAAPPGARLTEEQIGALSYQLYRGAPPLFEKALIRDVRRAGPDVARVASGALRLARRRIHRGRPLWSLVACMSLCAAASVTSIWLRLGSAASVWGLCLSLLAAASLVVCLSFRTDTQWMAVIARLAADHADPSDVGPLVDALEWADRETHEHILSALTPVQPQDLARLDSYQRLLLYRQLRPRRPNEERFQVALVKAIEEIGDTAALPFVEQMAHGERSVVVGRKEVETLAGTHPEVRAALRRVDEAYSACRWDTGRPPTETTRWALGEARKTLDLAVERTSVPVRQASQECLAHLRALVEENRSTGRLLRPAECPSTDDLLRPAVPGPETDPSTLLRPAPHPADTTPS